jgi:hypothetical protein
MEQKAALGGIIKRYSDRYLINFSGRKIDWR